jgi:hypothetical protein
LSESVGIFGLRACEVQKEVGRQSLPHQLCRPEFSKSHHQKGHAGYEHGHRGKCSNVTKYFSHARLLSLYVFILFSSCSIVNPKKPVSSVEQI